MTELVFQCPKCSAISRGGPIDKQAIEASRKSARRVICERCGQESLLPLSQMMLHDRSTARVVHFI